MRNSQSATPRNIFLFPAVEGSLIQWPINTIAYLLWLRLRTRRFLAFSKPSGTSFKMLWLRSKVVRSSRSNSWTGMPELFTRLWRMLRVLKEESSVNSPNSFCSPLCVRDKCSYQMVKGKSTLFIEQFKIKYNKCMAICTVLIYKTV